MLGVRIPTLALALFVLSGPAVASHADSGPCAQYDPFTMRCIKALQIGGGEERRPDQGKDPIDSGRSEPEKPRSCEYGGRPVQCESALGSWSSYASSWCRLLPNQPPMSDPVWGGEQTGQIYSCTRPGFEGLPDEWGAVLRWLPAPPEAAPPDPRELAQRLFASIDFQAPEIGIFPRGDSTQRMSYVGWNMWLWAAPTSELQWGPITDSISEGGVTVTLTATVSELVWDMGNGDSLTCGKGTPWSESATGGRNVASPDCGYLYETDGTYTVTATSNWDVQWSGGGQSGTIPLTLSRDAQVIVGELQSLNTGG